MEEPPANPGYPVSLVVAGRRCLVVGGGPVAARKVAGLVEAGADVTLVAPELSEEAERLGAAATVHVERRAYQPGEATDYRLVVTATGVPGVDRQVAADAEAAGVWVNSADDADHCSFILPAVHRDGPVTVAVSTGGSSPALARWLRDRLAVAVGPQVGVLAQIVDRARRRRRHQGLTTEDVDWQALFDGPLPDLVAQGRTDEAEELLRRTVG